MVAVRQAAMQTPCGKCLGIELSGTRHGIAEEAVKSLRQTQLVDEPTLHRMHLLQADFLAEWPIAYSPEPLADFLAECLSWIPPFPPSSSSA